MPLLLSRKVLLSGPDRPFGIAGKVYGVDLTLDLPAGVTVVASTDGTVPGAVLAATNDGSFSTAKYTAASGTTPGKIRLALVNSDGFSAGQFLGITLAVAEGVTPSFTSSLVESGVTVVYINGNASTGATVAVSAN